jgi:pimeloyl-ACP methyl ester carboxylesterase
MRLAPVLALLIAVACPALTRAALISPAVTADPPQDKAHPASSLAFALPTHGVKINALLLKAAGAGLHPTVLLLHGLPGNERNLDLAQTLRRAGWNVLTLNYRGSWGSPGDYGFAHCIEDAQAALDWLRAPDTVAAQQIDASRLVVIGHSIGGVVAAYVGAHDEGVLATGLISATDIGARVLHGSRPALIQSLDRSIGASAGMHAVNATPEALADELIAHIKAWDFVDEASLLAKRPLLLITSDDGNTDASIALAKGVAAAGAEATQVHLATDHVYSDKRIALEAAVVDWLGTLPLKR